MKRPRPSSIAQPPKPLPPLLPLPPNPPHLQHKKTKKLLGKLIPTKTILIPLNTHQTGLRRMSEVKEAREELISRLDSLHTHIFLAISNPTQIQRLTSRS